VAMADLDVERRALADARNRAESLLYSSERAISEFGHVLDPTEKEAIEAELVACKDILENGTRAEIEDAVLRLEGYAQHVGEAIYAAAEAAGGAAAEAAGDAAADGLADDLEGGA